MQNDIISKISCDKINSYLRKVKKESNSNYKFSTTPLLLKEEIFDKVNEISNSLLNILKSKEYVDFLDKKDFISSYISFNKSDYYGSIDFHINDSGVKIIEANMFPPGLSSFIGLISKNYYEIVLSEEGEIFDPSAEFERRLIKSISENKSIKTIALCEYNINEEYNLDEFKYLQNILKTENINLDLLDACEKNQLKTYERIYNRVIPTYFGEKQNELKFYIEEFRNRPELFFTNPNIWFLSDKLLSTNIKRFLKENSIFDNCNLSNSFLTSRKLMDFDSIQAIEKVFPNTSKTIIKPLSNFAGKGILLKPSKTSIQRLLDNRRNDLIIEELFPSGRVEYIKENKDTIDIKYDIRVVFLNGEISGYYARMYEGGITNFRGENGGIAPVFVIK
jgi:hypothetical protein